MLLSLLRQLVSINIVLMSIYALYWFDHLYMQFSSSSTLILDVTGCGCILDYLLQLYLDFLCIFYHSMSLFSLKEQTDVYVSTTKNYCKHRLVLAWMLLWPQLAAQIWWVCKLFLGIHSLWKGGRYYHSDGNNLHFLTCVIDARVTNHWCEEVVENLR